MPLRPFLYQRLELLFQDVAIANEGEPMESTVERNALTGKPRLQIIS